MVGDVAMKYIKRDMEYLIIEASEDYSCILINGPRQVGKTTMLEHIKPQNMQVVSLDDFNEREMAKNDPSLFLSIHPAPLIIDEVQYAPELFTYIKIAIDRGAPAGSYWLTGSQAFHLMDLAGESLAGRTAILHLTSLSQHELYGTGRTSPFTLSLSDLKLRYQTHSPADINEIYKRIWLGGLPAYASGKYRRRDLFYAGYVQTYISRDIKDIATGVDSTRFYDFIRATACRAGQILNIHSIATEVHISDDTAKRWIQFLEKTGIIFFLYPFSNNLLKRTIKAPKLYFFDTGLVAYLTKHLTPEILANSSMCGAILENYVISEIRKSYLNEGDDFIMHYYRDKDGREIDLCIQCNGKIHPIGIKRSNRASLSMTSSFKLLEKSTIPVGTGAVICLEKDLSALDNNTLIIPVWLI